MKNIAQQRIILMVVCAITAVSTFLPWLKATTGNTIGISTTGAHSWIVLLCSIGCIVVCTYGETSMPLESPWKYIAAALAAAAALAGILKVLNTIGIGLIIAQVASVMAVLIALGINPAKNKKGKIENIPYDEVKQIT